MSNRNNMIPIPGRLHSVAVGEPVSGADEVLDDALNMEQSKINQLTVGTKNASTGTTGAYPYNGMGRVVLPKNMVNGVNTLTQDMLYKGDPGSRVPNTNTIFVIQYDFVLGEDITVPANCILEFDGGSLSGAYTITGNNTQIKAQNVTIFNNEVIIAGSWICPRVTSSWFKNVTNNNRIKQVFNLTNASIQNEVIIEEGNYNVSVSTERETVISINSNTTLFLNGNIILSANSFDNYSIIKISSSYNVHIIGSGHIVGDVETHTGTTGEWGIGIEFYSAKNCYVEGVTCEKCWGDGIYIGSDSAEAEHGSMVYASKNIALYNVVCDSNRRQGLSIVHAENIRVVNSSFINTGTIKYTAPGYGIDIEPNSGDDWKQSSFNIWVVGCIFKGNFNGKALLSTSPKISSCYNIIISDCVFNNQDISITNIKNIHINNCYDLTRIIISGGPREIDTVPNIFINDTHFIQLYLWASNVSHNNIFIKNCYIGNTDTLTFADNAIYHNSGNVASNVEISDSKIYFNKSLTENSLGLKVDIRNSYIEEIESVNYLYVFIGNGSLINNIIKVKSRMQLGNMDSNLPFTMSLIGNIIHSETEPFYLWDGDSYIIRNNIFTNESVNLFSNINSAKYILIEGKVNASQDNLATYAGRITTLINRLEHFSV